MFVTSTVPAVLPGSVAIPNDVNPAALAASIVTSPELLSVSVMLVPATNLTVSVEPSEPVRFIFTSLVACALPKS